MKKRLKSRPAYRNINRLFSIIALLLLSAILNGQDIIITHKADLVDQFEDIQYTNIQVNQTIEFDNLIRVYINKSSVIMIDNSLASFEKVGEIVFLKLKTHIENNFGDLNTKTIRNARNNLKLLVRKSVLTNKSDFSSLMEMIDASIWKLQNYYCEKVYQTDYSSLTEEQKKLISKLVPLKNYLAEDVKF